MQYYYERMEGTKRIRENHMPHIIVKLYPGRSEQQKVELTKKIVKNVVEIAECKETSVSVAFEEIEPIDWAEKVYKPDIIDSQGVFYKKPGYDPFLSKQDKKEKNYCNQKGFVNWWNKIRDYVS